MSNPWLGRLRWVCATVGWWSIGIAAVVSIPLLIAHVPYPNSNDPDGTCGNLFDSTWRVDDVCNHRVTRLLWLEGSLVFIAAGATAGWIWAWRRD